MNVESLIDDVLEKEGRSYTNDPADRGGPTKFGITQATLSSFRGRPCTAQDVRELSEDEARRCYRKVFYEDTGVAEWPQELQALGFDLYVQHRPSTVGYIVQEVLHAAGFAVSRDNLVGPKTRAALHSAQAAMGDLLRDAICDERADHYFRLVARSSSQKRFLDGWLKRAASFRSEEPDWLPGRFRRKAPVVPRTVPAVRPPPPPLVPKNVTITPIPPPVTNWERIIAMIASLIVAVMTALGMGGLTPAQHAPLMQLETPE